MSFQFEKLTNESINENDQKFSKHQIGALALYIIGIIGSFVALLHLHLHQRKNMQNVKQTFMLKCLMMLDFIGLFGMFCSQSVMRFFLGGFKFKTFHQDHIHMFCMLILVWRFFGLTSGCVAFIMAVDRFLAMAKPFFYWEYITYGLVKKSILIMWCICAFITFAPTIGFGLYFDDGKITKCQRYRNASKIVDIVYAWLLFVIGTCLCIMMVVCNFHVTRIVLSIRNKQRFSISVMENLKNEPQPSESFNLHRNRKKSLSSESKSCRFVTREEIKFINMSNWLTGIFVITWGTQMITIPIAQLTSDANRSEGIRTFFQVADFFMLIHFTMDPYIYVLLRTNYWKRFKYFVNKKTQRRKHDDFDASPELDRNQIQQL